MFKHLIQRPAYIFKFAIYILFIGFAFIFYFSHILDQENKNLKSLYSLLLLIYGVYRLIRTYQELRAEIRNEQQNS